MNNKMDALKGAGLKVLATIKELKASISKEQIVTISIIMTTLGVVTITKLVRRSPIHSLRRYGTPASMSIFLITKCSNTKPIKNMYLGLTKDSQGFINNIKDEVRKALLMGYITGSKLNTDVTDRLTVSYEYIKEYAQLKKHIIALRDDKSGDAEKYTELLKTMLLLPPTTKVAQKSTQDNKGIKSSVSDWSSIGFQRSETPISDYRGAGALAPVMLCSLARLDKKLIQEKIDENYACYGSGGDGSPKCASQPYLFASVNIGIIFKTSQMLEANREYVVKYLLTPALSSISPVDSNVNVENTNPFDKVKEVKNASETRDVKEGRHLLLRRYAFLHHHLTCEFDKYFKLNNGNLMMSQTLLDKFFKELGL